MRTELVPRTKESIQFVLYFYLLLLLSLLAVQFPTSARGKNILCEDDLEGFSPPEMRVGKKLLELGFQPLYEKRQILLDSGVVVAKYKGSDRVKKKSLTVPDFFIRIGDIECFIEVGSNSAGSHKRDQQRIAEEAITFENARNIMYTQLFNGHIDQLEEEVHTQEGLLKFLQDLSHTVRVRAATR